MLVLAAVSINGLSQQVQGPFEIGWSASQVLRLSLTKPCENPNGFSPVINDGFTGDKDYRNTGMQP